MNRTMEVEISPGMDKEEEAKLECRACLELFVGTENLYNLFLAWSPPWKGMHETIAEDLTRLTDIKVSENDQFSPAICGVCCKKLKDACTFIHDVQHNDSILKQRHAGTSYTWPKPIQLAKNVNDDIFDTCDKDIKEEANSDYENDVSFPAGDSVADVDEYNLDIKLEPEEQSEIVVNGVFSLSTLDDDVTNTCTQISEPFSLSAVADDVTKRSRPDSNIYEQEEYLDVNVKEEPTSEPEVIPDLPLECLLCTKTFKRLSGLRAHVISQHSYKSVKRKQSAASSAPKDKHFCIACRRYFATSTDLMVHETCHNLVTCYACNEKFESFWHLSRHRKRCKALLRTYTPKPKTLQDVIRPPNREINQPTPAQLDNLKEVSKTLVSFIKPVPIERLCEDRPENRFGSTVEISVKKDPEVNFDVSVCMNEIPVENLVGDETKTNEKSDNKVDVKTHLLANIDNGMEIEKLDSNINIDNLVQAELIPDKISVANNGLVNKDSDTNSELKTKIESKPDKLSGKENIINESDQVKQIKCALCDDVFTDEYYLNIHLEVNHSQIQEKTNMFSDNDQTQSPLKIVSITEVPCTFE